MKQHYIFRLACVLMLGFSLVLTGCKDDDNPVGEPPVDGDPQINLVTPSTGYTLTSTGNRVYITFELFDKELITTFYLTEARIYQNVTVQAETELAPWRRALSTTQLEQTVYYDVPNVPVFSIIELRAYIVDNKGKVASKMFRINVVPDDSTTTAYELESYTNDTIWSILTPEDNYFDLINRRHGNQFELNMPDRTIGEISNPTFQGILNSPANGTTDSVMVWTNTGRFNFDKATYETIWEAYTTSNNIGTQAGPLSVNDIVILSLPNPPHYAILKIKEKDPGGCGCLVFDYKISYQ